MAESLGTPEREAIFGDSSKKKRKHIFNESFYPYECRPPKNIVEKKVRSAAMNPAILRKCGMRVRDRLLMRR
jgi:hypothetical protein